MNRMQLVDRLDTIALKYAMAEDEAFDRRDRTEYHYYSGKVAALRTLILELLEEEIAEINK